MANCTTIKELYLHWNEITAKGGEIILQQLAEN